MSTSNNSWRKFLHPETLKGNLINVSLFIAAYEMFCDLLEERPKTFFSNGFDQNGPIVDSEYAKEVLSKSRSPTQASLLWFQEMGAIDELDVITFDRIRIHRNEVTHNIVLFVSSVEHHVDMSLFSALVVLFEKVERWWVVNFELPLNPDFDLENVNLDEVLPGAVIGLKLMLDVALENEPRAGFYFDVINRKREERDR